MKNNSPIFDLLTHGEICKALGAQARARRKHLKLSRKGLSEKSGVSVPTISRFETTGVTTLGVVVKLAQALDAVEGLTALFSVPKYSTLKEFLEMEQ